MLAAFRHRFRLNAKATSTLGSVRANTRVKVIGEALPGKQLLTAPITGRSCVFYSVDIGEWFNGTKTPLLSETSTEMFRIEDDTGSALVDPSFVQPILRESRVRGHSSECLSEHRALLKRHGFTMLDDYGELRSLAYRETVVALNDRICVFGAVSQQPAPSGMASYRQQARQTVLGADRETPLLLCEA